MTKIKELRSLAREDLIQKEKAIKEQLFNLNYQRRFGRLEKPHMFKLLKRDIAKIATLLKEKEINASSKEKA